MASFRTEIRKVSAPFHINYDDTMVSLGSCFSDEIGSRLSQSKFNISVNPFGVLYNPSSIRQSLNILLDDSEYSENKIVEHHGLWQSFDFHSAFSDSDMHRCLAKIRASIQSARQHMNQMSVLVITFGTAHIYRLAENDRIVANCHKFPASHFKRERLTLTRIIDEYVTLVEEMQHQFPSLKIIFTLSPIRHLKDGFEENQVSKSILRIAIDAICQSTKNTHYFPSYEILMDDLRDYRFYAKDLLHPNDLAIEYIWEKFQRCYLKDETISIMNHVKEIMKASNHKPLHEESDTHKEFKKTYRSKVLALQVDFPKMNWDRELAIFKN